MGRRGRRKPENHPTQAVLSENNKRMRVVSDACDGQADTVEFRGLLGIGMAFVISKEEGRDVRGEPVFPIVCTDAYRSIVCACVGIKDM